MFVSVVAVYKEPIQGWVDNLNGPTGILIGGGKGVIRSMHCNTDLVADIVPVDMVINALLIYGWKMGISPRREEADVYHITANSVSENIVTFQRNDTFTMTNSSSGLDRYLRVTIYR